MPRSFLFAVSVSLFATAAFAAPDAGYEAQLAAPAIVRAMAHDVAWSCAGATCTAARAGTSPDAVMCAAVARKLGRLTGFTAGGRAFDAAALDRCNGASRTAAR